MNPRSPHRRKSPRASWLGMLAGSVMTFFGKTRKPTPEDLKKHDFPTTTQQMGIRFTERIRGVFRHRWLKKH